MAALSPAFRLPRLHPDNTSAPNQSACYSEGLFLCHRPRSSSMSVSEAAGT